MCVFWIRMGLRALEIASFVLSCVYFETEWGPECKSTIFVLSCVYFETEWGPQHLYEISHFCSEAHWYSRVKQQFLFLHVCTLKQNKAHWHTCVKSAIFVLSCVHSVTESGPEHFCGLSKQIGLVALDRHPTHVCWKWCFKKGSLQIFTEHSGAMAVFSHALLNCCVFVSWLLQWQLTWLFSTFRSWCDPIGKTSNGNATIQIPLWDGLTDKVVTFTSHVKKKLSSVRKKATWLNRPRNSQKLSTGPVVQWIIKVTGPPCILLVFKSDWTTIEGERD